MIAKYSEKQDFISNFKDNISSSEKMELKVKNRVKIKAFKYCKKCDIDYNINKDNFYFYKNGQIKCKLCEKTRNRQRIEEVKIKRKELNVLNGLDENFRSHFIKQGKRRCCKCNNIYPLTNAYFHIRNLNLKNKSKRFHHKCKNCRIKIKKSISDKLKNISIVCTYCGCKFIDNIKKTIDHIIPTSRGGKDNVENLTVCCGDCNRRKSDNELNNFLNKKTQISIHI